MHIVTSPTTVQPFVGELGELVYPMIGREPSFGGSTLHSLAYVLIPPGKSSKAHFHRKSEETYCILRGQGEMSINDRIFSLTPGQACLIQPHEVHQIRNDSVEPLEFLVICTPIWTPDDYFPV